MYILALIGALLFASDPLIGINNYANPCQMQIVSSESEFGAESYKMGILIRPDGNAPSLSDGIVFKVVPVTEIKWGKPKINIKTMGGFTYKQTGDYELMFNLDLDESGNILRYNYFDNTGTMHDFKRRQFTCTFSK